MRRRDPLYEELRACLGAIGAPLLVHCAHRNAQAPVSFTSEMLITSSCVHEIDITRAVDRRRQRAYVVRAHHPRADHADADGLDDAHVAVGKCMCDGSRASSGQRLVTTLPRV